MAKRRKSSKPRNWLAVHAHNRSGAGNHGDARKAASKNACRAETLDDEMREYLRNYDIQKAKENDCR